MLSYRHAFHAGNHADVLKHCVLVAVVRALQRKPTPLVMIDTHAGAGRYALGSEEALKVGEFRDGIAKIWAEAAPPAALVDYLSFVRAANPGRALTHYPGSPRFLAGLQRPGDRLVCVEKHPTDARALARELGARASVRIVAGDAWSSLRALIPPRERRGAVLIDPSYELKSDYRLCVETLADAAERWATGVYLLWYPLLQRREADRLLDRLTALGVRRSLCVELAVRASGARPGLWGSGMVVLNCPWQVDIALNEVVAWLGERLAGPGAAAPRCTWLVPD
jgi:23S rRNA (adenine2030-N6)-methyltransferase